MTEEAIFTQLKFSLEKRLSLQSNASRLHDGMARKTVQKNGVAGRCGVDAVQPSCSQINCPVSTEKTKTLDLSIKR